MFNSVAVYGRVSTRKQDISLQKKELADYCNTQGYRFSEYMDEFISGKEIERPAFKKIMLDAQDKKFDAIIVTKLDRFGRSIQDLVNTIKLLEGYGVKFISIKDNIDTSSPNGRLLFHILCAIAEFERELIIERMEAGRARAREEGKKFGRPRVKLDVKQLKDLIDKKISYSGISRMMGINRNTLARRIKELGLK